jgi:glycosyltransferase involved in cell wall biosynthesis
MDSCVSVIVPTYNRAHFLPECLDALFAQTVPAAEIIIVNDGSTDNTLEALSPYKDRITCLDKPNGGKASALNVGLARATGEFIWICDDDDLSLPNALQIHLDAIADNPHADFTFSGYHMGVPDTKTGKLEIIETFPPFQGTSKSLFLSFALGASGSGIGFMSQQGMLVRKRCFDVVGPFDETLIACEDREMNLRLCRAFHGIRIDQQTFIIRQHTGSRGPAHATYSYSEREIKLSEADQVVFRKLYGSTCLKAFLDDPALQESDQNWRGSALVRRSQIMACRKLAELAMQDLMELRDQILCGNINLSEDIVQGIILIERAFRNSLLPTEARFAQETVRMLLNSHVSSKKLRDYVARYFYWKGMNNLRAGKLTESFLDFVKSLDILVSRSGRAAKILFC